MSVLNNLSKGSGALKDAYNQVMIRIDGQLPDDCVLAKNVLSWISYAQRPLTIGELCHALAVEPGDEELDTDNILDVKDILSVCAGLVTVDKESQVVRLVHYTTQEYLDGIREKWNPDAQRNIASTCLTYLCFKPFKSGACSSDAEFKKRLRKHKFLDYSARYWGLHIASVQEQLSELAMVLLQDSKLIACVVQVNEGYSSYTLGEANGLHLAASFGLPHLVGKFLSCVVENGIVDINSRDGCGCTALSLAAKNGQEAVVKLLLEREDVEVDSRNDSLGWTVLMEAANECHKDIVKRLLDTGKADVNAQADEEYTALLLVSGKGHVDLVELLLNAGAAVNPQDEEGWSALMGAAFSGDKDVVELLLDAGADINARDMDGSTALSTAVPRGHKDIAELLLNVGADVNAKSGEGQSALMHAVNWEHQDIVELLLDSGAEINAKDEKGRSALMLATDQGDRGLVELLLSSGADINAKDEGGVTALMIAACEGHKDVVELLLNSGADINTKDRDGKTAFSKAVRRRYKDIAELLKKHIGSS
jgi:ankyrin repeat protein